MPARSVSWALGLAERAGHGEMPFQREFGGFRVELFAVVEFYSRAQLDRHCLAVGRRFVAERELRHDVELLVDVEQLVADRGKDDAAHVGARERRIEHIRIFRESDAQGGFRLREPAGAGDEQGREH
jgi:hypothetical protein